MLYQDGLDENPGSDQRQKGCQRDRLLVGPFFFGGAGFRESECSILVKCCCNGFLSLT